MDSIRTVFSDGHPESASARKMGPGRGLTEKRTQSLFCQGYLRMKDKNKSISVRENVLLNSLLLSLQVDNINIVVTTKQLEQLISTYSLHVDGSHVVLSARTNIQRKYIA